ncbi:MAG: chaperone modulator CbpM [Ferruginibacter sp.]|nr:chaperone modulator CbpM [Ferruginibacter sp.]
MQQQETIAADEFCLHHHVEMSFLYALKNEGLIELEIVEEKLVIPQQQLPQLEKMARLYYDMDINIEGIESITHLLNEMAKMQQHINHLNNRLQLYEGENEI